jgi:hypothetical protein
MFDDVIKNVHVCIPFRLLREKHLPMVIENRINPEIGIDGETYRTWHPFFNEKDSPLPSTGLSSISHLAGWTKIS